LIKLVEKDQTSTTSWTYCSLPYTTTQTKLENMAESTSAATAPLPSSAGPSSSTKPSQALWLRCEKKPHEQRCALTPNTAKTLIDNGFEIFVEKDNVRCYADEEFEA
jgi:hypothetical protein